MHRVSGAVIALVFTVGACGSEPAKEATPRVAVPRARAAHAPRGTLTALRWLMGSWRGAGSAGTVQEPFFERYSLANDSVLVVESFKDSTLRGVADSTRFDLRGDSLVSGEAAATSISPTSLTFSSRSTPGLAWTWRRDDDSSWTAIIVNSNPNGPPRTRVYRMSRIK